MGNKEENIRKPSLIDAKKRSKLMENFPKYLKSKRKTLTQHFGVETTDKILDRAELEYPGILSKIKNFHTPMYESF